MAVAAAPSSSDDPELTTSPSISAIPNLSPSELSSLRPVLVSHHTHSIHPHQCTSILAQRIHAPRSVVWSIISRFDKPQTYKHFIKSCSVPYSDPDHFSISVGATRDVTVISGLPAATSTERLDILDDDRYVFGFSIIGGEHRLSNYRSVTTVHELEEEAREGTGTVAVVLESYVVDVPEGNSEEDTRLFADTVVKLNLQKLAAVAAAMARENGGGGGVGK